LAFALLAILSLLPLLALLVLALLTVLSLLAVWGIGVVPLRVEGIPESVELPGVFLVRVEQVLDVLARLFAITSSDGVIVGIILAQRTSVVLAFVAGVLPVVASVGAVVGLVAGFVVGVFVRLVWLVLHRLSLGLLLGDELFVGRQDRQLESLRPRHLPRPALVVTGLEVTAKPLPFGPELLDGGGVPDVSRRGPGHGKFTQRDAARAVGNRLANHQRELRQAVFIGRLAANPQRLVHGQLDSPGGLSQLDRRGCVGQRPDRIP
jgi:hypothetical protein